MKKILFSAAVLAAVVMLGACSDGLFIDSPPDVPDVPALNTTLPAVPDNVKITPDGGKTVASPTKAAETPVPTSSPTPTPTPTYTPTPTPVPHIDAAEMFMESYFAIVKERLQTYKTDALGDSLTSSEFASYETLYNAEDYYDYEIKDDKVVFHFAENRLTGASHPAFDYECYLSEALAFMYYDAEGNPINRPVIRDLDPNAKMIALTYDDGPSPDIEKRLLEVLKKHDALATFFFITNKCDKLENIQSVLDIKAAGHEVASHEYSHIYYKGEDHDRKEIWTELNKANLILSAITGEAPRFVRMPGGCRIEYFKNLPMPYIGWSWGAEDWLNRSQKSGESYEDMLKRKAKETYENVTTHSHDGYIILMHSTYPEAPEATEKILEYLDEQGFICVTLDELFYYKGVDPENGVCYGLVRKQQP
ncbi:MAG: polysaccharide deacetylase family protein [Lachnospiraceae bacterium]|nr:polysaccharide deacetylase family protein [Lachnospiraceae bacterium]